MRFVKGRVWDGVITLVVRCTFRSLGRLGNVDSQLCVPHSEGGGSIGPRNGARGRATIRKVLPQLLEIIGRVSKTDSQLYVEWNMCAK